MNRQKNKLTGGTDYFLGAENRLVTWPKADWPRPMLIISKPGWHAVRITRHEGACILWDAWRKGKEGA